MPQFPEPVLGGGEVVAVEDSGAITRQPSRPRAAVHRLNHGPRPRGRRADQCRGQPRFGAVELVVNGVDRGPDGLGARLKGRVDRRPNATHHHAHQVDDRGEEEFFCILCVGDVFEELIDQSRIQDVLQRGLSHDGEWRILGKPLEHVAEEHRRLRGESVTPCLAAA